METKIAVEIPPFNKLNLKAHQYAHTFRVLLNAPYWLAK